MFFPTSLCGVLGFGCALPSAPSPPPAVPPQLAHTQLAHTQLSHTQLSHTQLSHTQLAHTQLAHTQLSHTHTQLTHTQLAHIPLCVAGVALMALGWLWWRGWVPLNAVVAAAVCVAGVALGDIHLHFAWQASRFATSTFTLRGRRGTWRHWPSSCLAGLALTALRWLWWRGWVPLNAVVAAAVCVAGVALGDIHLHFAWQASRFATSTFTLRGRRGTWRHWPSSCLAGLALTALRWLWWRAWVPFDAVVAAAVCVADVALGDIHLHFAWQARHLATLTFTWLWWRAWVPFDAVVAAVVCVAGVPLGDIDLPWWSAPASLDTLSLTPHTSCRSPLFMAWGMFCVWLHNAHIHTYTQSYIHTHKQKHT